MSTDERLAARYALLRWLAVIPAAILAGGVAHFAFGLVSVVVARLVSESYYVRLLL